MTVRIGLFVGALVLAGVALWHPAPRPAFQPTALSTFPAAPVDAAQRRHGRGERARAGAADAVVYVAGAVRRPGLYHIRAGNRAADAIAQAGGLTIDADAGGINLAAHASDGDEVYVPVVGEGATHRSSAFGSRRRTRSHRGSGMASVALAPASVDVNAAEAAVLATVPGIGKSIGARIVEMRSLDGSFRSLDELLDVAGMTQTRLERARPFLRPP
jgi:competence protein ComEA